MSQWEGLYNNYGYMHLQIVEEYHMLIIVLDDYV